MLLKLAVRNVRRSVRDYAIYFITLLFGVAVFYAFNSIGDQKILFDIESSTTVGMFDSTLVFIALFSVIVAAVLGFLVLYANRMLVRRRKQEFGIYLTLGMSPSAVSRIVLYETVIVGIVSLALGIVLGVLLSQLLSFVTAAIFEMTMVNYQFVFSSNAFLMTLVCFAAIYVVVSVFNVVTVRKFKLITLLSAEASNERVIVRNPWICLVVFMLSVAMIVMAYATLSKSLIITLDQEFWIATILMLVGTLAFFWSLAGFVTAILANARGVYLRGLIPFTVRQIASRINTAFMSLWIVCVLLFFAITTFSVGMGIVSVLVGDIEEANPYDATLATYAEMGSYSDGEDPGLANDPTAYEGAARAFAGKYPDSYACAEEHDWDMEAALGSMISDWGEIVSDCAQFDAWEVPGLEYGFFLEGADLSAQSADTNEAIGHMSVLVASVTQYNAHLRMQGEPLVELGDDEYLLSSNSSIAAPYAQAILDGGRDLEILGRSLSIKDELGTLQYDDGATLDNNLTMIVPDAVIDAMREAGAVPLFSKLNVAYVNPGLDGDDALLLALRAAFPPTEEQSLTINGVDMSRYYRDSVPWPVYQDVTKQDMISQATGFRMLVSYLALYIGFVFLIATAAILAIQQVSQAIDSESRYRLLSRLGCDGRMLGHSLLAQVMIYFLAPLVLAICHSICAINVFNANVLSMVGMTNTLEPILASTALIAIIYGGYMLVTYFFSRGIVRQSTKA